jgi:hypothetical protein
MEHLIGTMLTVSRPATQMEKESHIHFDLMRVKNPPACIAENITAIQSQSVGRTNTRSVRLNVVKLYSLRLPTAIVSTSEKKLFINRNKLGVEQQTI